MLARNATYQLFFDASGHLFIISVMLRVLQQSDLRATQNWYFEVFLDRCGQHGFLFLLALRCNR